MIASFGPEYVDAAGPHKPANPANPTGFWEDEGLASICRAAYPEPFLQPAPGTSRADRVAKLRGWYQRQLARRHHQGPQSPFLLAKHPTLCLMCDEIREAWPLVRFIEVCRPLPSVQASIRSRGWGWPENAIAEVPREMVRRRDVSLEGLSHESVLTVDYDTAVDAPGLAAARIAAWLGIHDTAAVHRAALSLDPAHRHASTPAADLPVWQYWTGPKPPWIELCLESADRHIPAGRLRRLDLESFERLHAESGGPASVNLRGLSPNHQSDYVRAYLLRRFGGLWLDADCIVLDDPAAHILPLLARPRPRRSIDFVTYGYEADRATACALVAALAGSKIATTWHNQIAAMLAPGTAPPAKWGAFGPDALTAAIHAHAEAPVLNLPWSLVHPIHFRPESRKAFQERGNDRWHRQTFDRYAAAAASELPGHSGGGAGAGAGGPWCYMLTHRSLGDLVHATRDGLLGSDTFAGYLFRRATLD